LGGTHGGGYLVAGFQQEFTTMNIKFIMFAQHLVDAFGFVAKAMCRAARTNPKCFALTVLIALLVVVGNRHDGSIDSGSMFYDMLLIGLSIIAGQLSSDAPKKD
jgi:hypothetical protein